MFDKNFVYKGHNFKDFRNISTHIHVECAKCKYYFEYKQGSIFVWSITEELYMPLENILSCDEMIIKNIIE